MTPNDDDRRAAAETAEIDLINAIISAYHTTRLREIPAALHILRKDRVRRMFDEMHAAGERRGIERAAQVADEHACQHCAHISAAIRSTAEGADK